MATRRRNRATIGCSRDAGAFAVDIPPDGFVEGLVNVEDAAAGPRRLASATACGDQRATLGLAGPLGIGGSLAA
jgi:hypothetical protein